jgi:hypothetical protein
MSAPFSLSINRKPFTLISNDLRELASWPQLTSFLAAWVLTLAPSRWERAKNYVSHPPRKTFVHFYSFDGVNPLWQFEWMTRKPMMAVNHTPRN